MSERAPDAALWRSVQRVLDEVVLGALAPGPAAATARQLSGLAAYALRRGDDPEARRAGVVAGVLGLPPDTSWADAARAACEVLQLRPHDDLRRRELRTVLLRFVDEDAAAAQPLLDTFARHGDPIGEDPGPPAVEAVALQAWLGAELATPVHITRAAVMSGGHSRRMLDVVAETPGGRLDVVVRVEQGGVFGTDGHAEAAAMRALAAAGVPVAPVLMEEPTGAVLGHPFFVMARVEGTETSDGKALGDYLDALDALHRVPVAQVAAGFTDVPPNRHQGVAMAIDRWAAVYRSAAPAPVPLLEEGAGWLRANLEPTGPLVVVHGDPGPGNFLWSDGRISALTDWEFAHIGDAAEDWAYLAALRGARVHDEATWRRLLAERIGVTLPPEAWHAWTVFNVFKGACANLTALRVFREGVSEWPNLLAVGTAVQLRFLRRLADLVA